MLHGEIKVNGVVIATWQASRGEKITDEPVRYSYHCNMTYRNIQGYPLEATDYQVVHRYGDGPIVLVNKVLEIGYDELRHKDLTLEEETELIFRSKIR